MAKFDDLLKVAQLQKNIQKSLGLSSQLSEMFKAQEILSKNFSTINMAAEIAKSMKHHHKMFENSNLSAIEAMRKSIDFQSKFRIPQTTIDAIKSINRQHDQLFGPIRNLTQALAKNQSSFSQINNWQFAISNISGQLAAIAASQRKWNLIDDFEKITEEAVSLNERIFDEGGVTREGLDELRQFFQRIEIKVDKIDTDANALFWKLLTLLSFILAVMGETRNWLPKPEYATRQEVETVIKEQFTLYTQKLKEDKEFRITTKACKVMSKPRLKSIYLETLPRDFEVTVLHINHKWVYVSYFSPIDNLPQAGWIMKKYLAKGK